MLARFVLEQEILDCWNIVEDLQTVAHALEAGKLNGVEAKQLLLGMAQLYQLKFDKTFNTFETVCKECQTAAKAQALDH